MSELISGKEAKLAWANDEKIEYTSEDLGDWIDLTHANTLGVFEREDFKFRLKPRTITLNGIEVPAPFEPKEGDVYWHIDTDFEGGYDVREYLSESSMQLGAWRTEDEIKQVVAALRKIFVINNQ